VCQKANLQDTIRDSVVEIVVDALKGHAAYLLICPRRAGVPTPGWCTRIASISAMSCRMAPGAAGRFFTHQSEASSICTRACAETRILLIRTLLTVVGIAILMTEDENPDLGVHVPIDN
jgi:hypothetical protein